MDDSGVPERRLEEEDYRRPARDEWEDSEAILDAIRGVERVVGQQSNGTFIVPVR